MTLTPLIGSSGFIVNMDINDSGPIDRHGMPEAMRSDNGPEFRSETVQAWARAKNIRWDFIQPGCPAQNAYIERFNGTYRLEVLGAHQFFTLDDARTVTEEWLAVYNEQRTHSAIGHLPPLASKRKWQQREFPGKTEVT